MRNPTENIFWYVTPKIFGVEMDDLIHGGVFNCILLILTKLVNKVSSYKVTLLMNPRQSNNIYLTTFASKLNKSISTS